MSTPLIERLRAGLSSPPCNADGTYTVGNCSPDALCREAAAEIERLRADAARYRWLRLKVYVCPKEHILRIADTYLKIGAVPEMLDSAIDAAMRDAPNV